MATAPKSVPKAVPKAGAQAEPPVEAPVVKKSKKKLFLLIGAVLVLLGGGGGATWYFVGGEPAKPGDPAKAHKAEPAKAPVFLVMDPFTVNLTTEGGEQFLQVSFTLQVDDNEQAETIKLYMPQVRSRLLLLLSSKRASEISSVDGKKKLSDEIIAQVKMPFTPKGPPQGVSNVFFTSFVIQ